jgi:hypothetical protein
MKSMTPHGITGLERVKSELIFTLNYLFINRFWFDSTPKKLLSSIQESEFSDAPLLTMVVGVIICSSESCTLLGYYLASTKYSAFLIYFAAPACSSAEGRLPVDLDFVNNETSSPYVTY